MQLVFPLQAPPHTFSIQRTCITSTFMISSGMFHFTWDAKNRCDRDRVKGQKWDFPGGSVVKNMPANIGDARVSGSIPGSGRFPGGGYGYPLQHSCLTVHGVAVLVNFIFEFSVHTFLMFCFLSCSVSGMGKRQTLKKNLLYR